MTIAILDPFSGISGDMTLGALLAVGLDPAWLRALPARLGLDGVTVRIAEVQRAGIGCVKVDFDIPPQPHGRHLKQIRELVARSEAPPVVKARADAAFTAIAEQEAAIHGTTVERVHLHEVGAVDAILDVVGAVWGFELLGVERVYCGPISLGDGFVDAAHGRLPVPAPATLRLLEGLRVRPGPEGSGELVTPTGAALVRVLSSGPMAGEYTPLRSGFGAGTREFAGRPNALRITLAEVAGAAGLAVEHLVLLACDLDDLTGEYVAGAAERLREAGALDVVVIPTLMKKGRPGFRLEILARPGSADALQRVVLEETTTLGIRRTVVERHALPREVRTVRVAGHDVRVKIAVLPDGTRQVKPEYEDVRRVALATARTLRTIFSEAAALAADD
jgi:pyridinium-3,5-bisthiocarboxylic acid mononucleotide nickel chelatase